MVTSGSLEVKVIMLTFDTTFKLNAGFAKVTQ
jgi:hypothetical protein